MQTYDYRKDKNRKSEGTSKQESNDEIFDVDSIMKKSDGVTTHHPGSAEGWHKKLEAEDNHFRSIK